MTKQATEHRVAKPANKINIDHGSLGSAAT